MQAPRIDGKRAFFAKNVRAYTYIPLEKKRQTIELLNNTMVREVGYKGEMKVIVLFQYHDDEGVGKDGELFADFKARQAQQ